MLACYSLAPRPGCRDREGHLPDCHAPLEGLLRPIDGVDESGRAMILPEARARVGPEVVQAAMLGDGDALAKLLAAAQPDIRRFARRTCRTSSDVDDAVQEALWLVARRIGTLRAFGAFWGWLFAIVTRECLRLARRALPGGTLDDEADRLPAERSDPDLRLDVAAALQSLPEHYRAVILLRDIEERTIDEIATALDLTREAAKARLHRARGLVREYLLR